MHLAMHRSRSRPTKMSLDMFHTVASAVAPKPVLQKPAIAPPVDRVAVDRVASSVPASLSATTNIPSFAAIQAAEQAMQLMQESTSSGSNSSDGMQLFHAARLAVNALMDITESAESAVARTSSEWSGEQEELIRIRSEIREEQAELDVLIRTYGDDDDDDEIREHKMSLRGWRDMLRDTQADARQFQRDNDVAVRTLAHSKRMLKLLQVHVSSLSCMDTSANKIIIPRMSVSEWRELSDYMQAKSLKYTADACEQDNRAERHPRCELHPQLAAEFRSAAEGLSVIRSWLQHKQEKAVKGLALQTKRVNC